MEKESIMVVGVIAVITVLICLLCIKLNEYFVSFNRKTKNIVFGLERSKNAAEYNAWLVNLRCHYLTLIPFVNNESAKKLYPKIFKKAKNKSSGFMHVVAPSIVGMCICAVCLCGMSWAWFTADKSAEVAPIRAAYLHFEISVKDGENEVEKNSETDSYALHAGQTYNVTLTVSGNASTGFAEIFFGGEKYYSPQLKDGDTFEFALKPSGDGELAICWQWGTCSAEKRIEKGAVLGAGENTITENNQTETPVHTPTAEVTPTPKPTAEPTAEPTATPTVTPEPTPTATSTPAATPEVTPTAEPADSPTATP